MIKADGSCCICDFGLAVQISGSKYYINGEEQHAETKSINDVSKYMIHENICQKTPKFELKTAQIDCKVMKSLKKLQFEHIFCSLFETFHLIGFFHLFPSNFKRHDDCKLIESLKIGIFNDYNN